MGKPLTDAQRGFISKFIVNMPPKEAAKITKAYQAYDRRRQKVADSVAQLDPASGERAQLEALMDAATKKAKARDGSGFSAAYDDLETVKSRARASAKGYVRALSPGATAATLARLEQGLVPIEAGIAQSDDVMQDVLDELDSLQAPADADLDAIMQFRQGVTAREARLRGEVAKAQALTSAAAAAATALGIADALKSVRHEIEQMEASGDKKAKAAAGPLATRMATLQTRAQLDNGMVDGTTVQGLLNGQLKEFEDALTVCKTFQNRDAVAGQDRFKHLEEREEAAMTKARTAYSHALAGDQAALDPRYMVAPKPKAPPPMGKFLASDILPDDVAGITEDELDGPSIQTAAKKIGANAAALVLAEAQRDPNSDVLFDLSTKSLNDLRDEVAKSLGLTGPIDEWPPNMRLLAENGAALVKDAVLQNSPNKTSAATVKQQWDGQDYDVPATVAVNGTTYDSPEVIGKGGVGLITRYKGPAAGGQPGGTVVMKSTLGGSGDAMTDPSDSPGRAADKRAEMVREMKVHRAMMGGEGGTPPENVVAMKGAAVGADGSLHMIMEEAEAGDANNLGQAITGLVDSGVLPKAAQQAMLQDTMLQAAKGLKAMHDNGLLHNDIKAVNYLVDKDGIIKVSDFGSGEAVETGGDRNLSRPTTGAYAADDFFQTGATEKTDIFSLGSMLNGMGSDRGIDGKVGEEGAFLTSMGKNAVTGHDATSLDRLRNAMMDPDPKKRPTLEGVLMSSYLNDARETFGDADEAGGPGTGSPEMTALRKALAAYSTAVGREVGALGSKIAELEGQLLNLRRAAEADPAKLPAYEAKQKTSPQAVKDLQAQIEAINQRPDVAKLVDAVKAAGVPFGTAKGKEKDNQWDFAYRKVMATTMSGSPPPRARPRMRAGAMGQRGLRDRDAALAQNP